MAFLLNYSITRRSWIGGKSCRKQAGQAWAKASCHRGLVLSISTRGNNALTFSRHLPQLWHIGSKSIQLPVGGVSNLYTQYLLQHLAGQPHCSKLLGDIQPWCSGNREIPIVRSCCDTCKPYLNEEPCLMYCRVRNMMEEGTRRQERQGRSTTPYIHKQRDRQGSTRDATQRKHKLT